MCLFFLASKELTNKAIVSSYLCIGSAMAKDQYETWLQAINSIISGENKSIEEEDLMFIAILPFHNSSGYLHQEMKKYLKMIVGDPLLPLLKIAYQHLEEAIADTRDLADFPEQHAKVFSIFVEEIVVIQILHYD